MEKMSKNLQKIINFLSEKLNLDIDYFLRAGVSSQVMLGTDILFGFLFIFFLTQYFNQSQVGKYYFIISAYGIATIFTLPGFSVASKRSLIKGRYSSYKRTLKIQLWGSAITTFLLLISSVYAYYEYPGLWMYLLVIAFFTPASILNLYDYYLYSKDNFKEMAKLSVMKRFLYYGGSIIAILLRLDLLIVIIVFFLFQLVFGVFYVWEYYLKIDKKEDTSEKDPELLPSGLKFSFIHAFVKTANHLDKVILSYFLGLTQLAVYSVALIVPKKLFNFIKKTSINLFFKKTLEINPKTLIKKLKENSIYIITGIVVMTAAVWHIIPFFYKLMFPDYVESIIYAQALILVLIFVVILELFIRYLESNDKSSKLFKLEVLGNVFQIGLYASLIPIWGIWGAILAYGISVIIKLSYTLKMIFF